ncbi:uncharacterized protein Dwil_GK25012 [Drosophila willistoni]|uniref:Putative ionotropic receptor ligand binding domain-containing protein n=1 Tax=Drosophila willistoni TaxID=7260 RepID=B4NCW3_DROWI|nr:uncharacterized protein LOC6649158 [Drosophila willistoni]EDW82672.2 uncharacterized protein Dwil_GK25012 [Drosophila willistoni]
MNISQLWTSYQDRSGEQMNHINEFVARALLHVVHQHIMSVTPSLVLTLCCRNNHTCNFYNEMMSIMFRQWGISPLQIVNVEEGVPWRRIPGRRHFNVIFTDSFAAFAEIRVNEYSLEYNYNEYYFIFLQARDYLHHTEMMAIFQYCWHYQLINCNIQVQKSNGDILIYSYYPFSRENCNDIEPQLINRYNGSSFINPDLFPRKLINLYGCPLRAAIWNEPPFIWLTERENKSENFVSGGYEGNLLLSLAKKMNFTIAIRKPPNIKYRDEAMNMLLHNDADLSLGGFRQTVERTILATSTHNYHQTRQVFGLLDASFELGSFDILLYPYPLEIWLGILGVLGLALFIQLALDRLLHESHQDNWLNLELIFVGMPLLQTPRSSAKRMYCIMLMFYTLLIRTVYQGLLYHLIRTHQLYRLPQTIDELVGQNYTVVVTPTAQETLSGIPRVQHMNHRVIASTSETRPLEFLAEHPEYRRHTVATAEDVFIYHNRRNALKASGHFELVPQELINIQFTMYLPKHSYLVDHINEEIMWMRSVGLLVIWARWELDESYLKNIQSFKILNLTDLYAIFLLVAMGLILSTAVFTLEILSRHWLKLQNLFL